MRSLDDLQAVVAFFEERRGRLYGFRWRDALDAKSCASSVAPGPFDQQIGTGDGMTADFQLVNAYGAQFAAWQRRIVKPVAGSVRIAVGGTERSAGLDFVVDTTTGLVTFLAGRIPGPGAAISAGFEFDVPVRFDSDRLEINLSGFRAGAIPSIPLVEVRV